MNAIGALVLGLIVKVTAASTTGGDAQLGNVSVIRYGYGLMYEYWGRMHYNLDRYDLTVGINLPEFNFTARRNLQVFENFDTHCESINDNFTDLKDMCFYLWPLYYYYRVQEQNYQYQIKRIMTVDLPAILPGYDRDPNFEAANIFKDKPDLDPMKGFKERHQKYLQHLEHRRDVLNRDPGSFSYVGNTTGKLPKHSIEHVTSGLTDSWGEQPERIKYLKKQPNSLTTVQKWQIEHWRQSLINGEWTPFSMEEQRIILHEQLIKEEKEKQRKQREEMRKNRPNLKSVLRRVERSTYRTTTTSEQVTIPATTGRSIVTDETSTRGPSRSTTQFLRKQDPTTEHQPEVSETKAQRSTRKPNGIRKTRKGGEPTQITEGQESGELETTSEPSISMVEEIIWETEKLIPMSTRNPGTAKLLENKNKWIYEGVWLKQVERYNKVKNEGLFQELLTPGEKRIIRHRSWITFQNETETMLETIKTYITPELLTNMPEIRDETTNETINNATRGIAETHKIMAQLSATISDQKSMKLKNGPLKVEPTDIQRMVRQGLKNWNYHEEMIWCALQSRMLSCLHEKIEQEQIDNKQEALDKVRDNLIKLSKRIKKMPPYRPFTQKQVQMLERWMQITNFRNWWTEEEKAQLGKDIKNEEKQGELLNYFPQEAALTNTIIPVTKEQIMTTETIDILTQQMEMERFFLREKQELERKRIKWKLQEENGNWTIRVLKQGTLNDIVKDVRQLRKELSKISTQRWKLIGERMVMRSLLNIKTWLRYHNSTTKEYPSVMRFKSKLEANATQYLARTYQDEITSLYNRRIKRMIWTIPELTLLRVPTKDQIGDVEMERKTFQRILPTTRIRVLYNLSLTDEECQERTEKLRNRMRKIFENAIFIAGQWGRLRSTKTAVRENIRKEEPRKAMDMHVMYEKSVRKFEWHVSNSKHKLWQLMSHEIAQKLGKKIDKITNKTQNNSLKQYREELNEVIRNNEGILDPEPITPGDVEQILRQLGVKEEGHPRKRVKRQLGILGAIGNLAFSGYRAYVEDRRAKKFNKALKILEKQQQQNRNEIEHIQDDMITVARVNLEQYQKIKDSIDYTNKRLDLLAEDVETLENSQAILEKDIEQLHYALYYTGFVVGNLYPAIERLLSNYEVMITELETIMSALDRLSDGLLSHNLIQPGQMAELIQHVSTYTTDKYPEYRLVMTRVQQYYDFPQVTFKYFNNMVVIQMPMYLRKHEDNALYLYNLRTVPVPFNMHTTYEERRQKRNTQQVQELKPVDTDIHPYTWLHPKRPLLAMSSRTYVGLDRDQLHNCFKFGDHYMCSQTLLTQQNTDHTCESAIFHNMGEKYILDKCNFTFYLNLHPEPTIFDSGKHVLLANVPSDWEFDCLREKAIPPNKVGGTYIMIEKKQLCLCDIILGKMKLHGSINSCGNVTGGVFELTYTVNQAVLLNFPESGPKVDLRKDIMLKIPHNGTFRLPKIETAKRQGILEKPELTSAPLESLVKALKHNYTLARSEADKALLDLGEEESMSIWEWIFAKRAWILLALGLAVIIAGIILYKCGLKKLLLGILGPAKLKVLGMYGSYGPTRGQWFDQIRKRIRRTKPTRMEEEEAPGIEMNPMGDQTEAPDNMESNVSYHPAERVASAQLRERAMEPLPTAPQVELRAGEEMEIRPYPGPVPHIRKRPGQLYPKPKLYWCMGCKNTNTLYPCPVCRENPAEDSDYTPI